MHRWKALLGISVVCVTTSVTVNHAGASPSACTVWTTGDDDPPVLAVVSTTLLPENVPAQVDLTSETMTVKNGTLIIDIHVVDMETQVPVPYDELRWVAQWSYQGVTWWATASYSASQGSSFWVGGVGGIGSSNQPRVDVTGSIVTGPDGYAEIDIPLSTVGDPPSGSTLAYPSADTMELVLGTGGTVDAGGPQRDYVIGRGCA